MRWILRSLSALDRVLGARLRGPHGQAIGIEPGYVTMWKGEGGKCGIDGWIVSVKQVGTCKWKGGGDSD